MSREPTSRNRKRASRSANVIPLSALSEGMLGLTSAGGQVLAEAAAVCLESQGHRNQVRLPRTGSMFQEIDMEWEPTDDQIRRCHADMQEATERGACGIAILVVKEVTGMQVVERSKKGTGFDYWVGTGDHDALPFTRASRLEVSGILNGTSSQIDSRLKQKKEQITRTDHVAPGFVAVVEFGTPIAHLEKK